jgi:DNA integrity scanning protein DisA with diadenylate cyclase activity
MKLENRLEGDSNFRVWKTRIDLILSKNEAGKEKELENIAVMEKFKDNDINAMSIIVDYVKDDFIPYISHLDSSKKM